MIDNKYSAERFERLRTDPEAMRALADDLAHDILIRCHEALLPEFKLVVAELNDMGHALAEYGDAVPGDLAFRDEDSYQRCRLRVGMDLIISTGYADTIPEIGTYKPETANLDDSGGQ